MLAVDIKNELYFKPEERGSHILDTGQEEVDVYRMRRKDGSEIWVEDHGSYIHDEQGNIIYHEGILRDVTERKKIEDALVQSEQAHRSLFENVPVGLYRTSGDGILLDANPAIVKIFGYQDKESLLGVNVQDLYADPAFNKEFNDEIKKGDIVTSMEAEFRKKDGSTFWAEDNIQVIRDENGNPQYYEGSLTDITDRKRVDIALAENEARFRQAIAAADAIPYSLDYSADRYSFIGEGITKLTGYALEETTPALLDALIVESIMHGTFEGMPLEEAVRLVREGKSGVLWQCDHRIRTHSGEEHWISDASIQVLDERGIPKGSIGIIQDVTERKQVEAAAREGEARYRSLFEDSPISLWEQDFSAVKLRLDDLKADGIQDFRAYFASDPQKVLECVSLIKIKDVNKAALKLFGAKEKTELFHNLSAFFNKDSAELFQNELISIAQGKLNFEGEGISQTLDGRQIIVRLSLSVMAGYEETFSKVIISMMDITARIQAEKGIRESERNLRESQEIAGLGTYVLDIKSGIWSSSHILNQIFGIDESYNRSVEGWLALTHPAWREEMDDYVTNEVIGKHNRFDKEYIIIRLNDGAERWVHGMGELELDSQNQPIKMNGIIQDITERKLAEIEIKERTDDMVLINSLNEAINRGGNLDSIIKLFAQRLIQAFGSYTTTFYLPGPDGNTLVMQNIDLTDATVKQIERLIGRSIPQIEVPLKEGSYFHDVLHSEHGILTTDTDTIHKWLDGFTETKHLPKAIRGSIRKLIPQINKLMNIRSLISIPLVSEKKIIALFDVSSTKILTEKDLDRIQKISSQLTSLILRKQADEKLHSARQFLQSAQDALSAHIAILDHEGNIIQVNSGWRNFGIKNGQTHPNHYIGINYLKVCDSAKGQSKEEASLVANAIREVLAGKKDGISVEYPCHAPHEQRWFVARITGFENNGQRWIVLAHENITDRKLSEITLRESEERYRALFENMPVSIWEEDFSEAKAYLYSLKQQGVTDFRAYFESHPHALLECAEMIKVLDVNQATLNMYHADSKEDLFRSMDQGLTKSELEHIGDALIAISEGLTSHSWEGSDQTITGEPIDVNLSWSVTPGHEVDFSKVIVTTFDITKRKRAEEALRASEEKYRLIIENAGEALYIIQNGLVVFVNPMFEKIAELPASELLGKSIIEFIPSTEDRMRALINHRRLLRGQISNTNSEFKVRLKSGVERWIDVNEVRTTWDGELAALTFATDITERKLREREKEALASITQALSQNLDLDMLLQNLLNIALRATPAAEKGAILLLDNENTLRIRALIGYQDQRVQTATFPSNSGYSARAVRELLPMIIQDARAEAPTRYNAEIEEMEAVQSAIVAPLTIKGQAIGAIALDNASRKNAFSPSELSTLSNFAAAAALAIQNTRLFEETRQRVTELELLYESGLAISQLLNPKDIAQKMIDLLEQKMNWHHTAVRLYNAEDDTLELLAFHQPGAKSDEERLKVEARFKTMISNSSQGLSGWAVQHAETVRVGNLKNDDRYVDTFPGLHSGLYVPIKTGERVIGVISIESETENAFNKSDEQLTTILATQTASIFENARLYKEITQRAEELEQRVKERTAQIETTKRRLELATHAGQIGVWEYIPRENKVIWDKRMHMIHQIPEGEFDGTSQTWAKLFHPEDIEQSQVHRQLAVTKNLLLSNEHRIIWPDGSIRNIMTSAVTAYGPDGTPERIIGINMDITERKQIEQSLRESENYARLLFDAVPDPVSVTDDTGLIVDVNKVFEDQFHLMRDDIRGRRVSELAIYPESELEKREQYLSEVLEGQAVAPLELAYYVPGDRIHTLELHSYPLKFNGRQLILNTTHDITSHKKAEEAQRLAKSEIERALRIKNEFLANMSHELRTPLNSILGISESLEEQIIGELNEKQLKYIGIVHESGRHLLDLINDILDLSKIEAGRMELDIHRISVETVCQSSLRMIKELSQKKNLHVSFKVKDDINVVLADQRRLKQSLVNLLGNAVKFTPPGKEIGLEVSGNMKTNEVAFTVWDQGVGIAQEDMKLLFKPFVQLDAGLAREFQGTGLGLALVAQMIDLHNGRVSVESEPGKGSRFTITLPWLPNEQMPKAKVTAELATPIPRSHEKRSGRILLVEDTDVVGQLVTDYLQHRGYKILHAFNGVEAIKMTEKEHPDLILMDVMMPIMDGLEATQHIRKNKIFANTPIIALTALAMSGDSERCLAAGMNDYLSKPIQMQDLADMIEKYLKPPKEGSDDQ